MTGAFLRFDSLIAPPPWPAVFAVVVVAGAWWLGAALVQRLRGEAPASALEVAAGFVLVTALIAALVHALAIIGAAKLVVLRLVGLGLAISALGWIGSAGRTRVATFLQTTGVTAFDPKTLEGWAIGASGVTFIALGIASLGPPTDIDTLAYQLSVPLDWLAHGGATAAPDWLHARLVGLGEALNMLGLAIGTDCLGSAFQFAGILAAVTALTSVASTQFDRVFAIVIVAACPLLPSLTLTSKPQLLPAAASAVALALLVVHHRASRTGLDAGTLLLIFGCSSFAVACKYSFIPGGIALATLIVWSLRHTSSAGRALLIGLSMFVVIALPVYLRNLLFYGDPLSPLFERLRPDPDPVVTTFAWYLRNFGASHSLMTIVRAPWDLVMITGPGQLTNALGAGALAVIVALNRTDRNRDVLAASAFISLVATAVGQLQARFFLEPYLWFGVTATLASHSLRKEWLLRILQVQLIVTSAVAVYSGFTFLPSLLTAAQRDSALTRLAPDYALAKWLDATLPPDAIVASDRRSILFMPRRALSSDLPQLTELAPLSPEAKRARILNRLAGGGANTLLITSPPKTSPYASLIASLGAPVHVSPVYPDAARNPWRQGNPYKVLIYDLIPRSK